MSSPILRDKNRCEIGAISAKIKAWAPTLSIAGMASPNVGDSQSIQSSGGDSYIIITEVRSPERRPVHTQRYHWVAVGGGSMHSHPLTGCVVLVAGARRGGRSVPAHTQRSGSAAAPDKARGCAPGIDAVCVISHACAWLAPARTTAHDQQQTLAPPPLPRHTRTRARSLRTGMRGNLSHFRSCSH